MIREAVHEDLSQLALMLKLMAVELMPEYATKDEMVYIHEVLKYMVDPEYTVYVDAEYKGFFMVKDDYDPIFEGYRRYIGTKVYIKPKYRHGKTLRHFYDRLFKDYPDGDIIGLTEIDSPHIAVLNKRHTHIANVYILNKEK